MFVNPPNENNCKAEFWHWAVALYVEEQRKIRKWKKGELSKRIWKKKHGNKVWYEILGRAKKQPPRKWSIADLCSIADVFNIPFHKFFAEVDFFLTSQKVEQINEILRTNNSSPFIE